MARPSASLPKLPRTMPAAPNVLSRSPGAANVGRAGSAAMTTMAATPIHRHRSAAVFQDQALCSVKSSLLGGDYSLSSCRSARWDGSASVLLPEVAGEGDVVAARVARKAGDQDRATLAEQEPRTGAVVVYRRQ